MKQRQEMDFVRGVKTKCRGFAGVLSGRNTAATCTCSTTQYGPGITFERRCQASTLLAHACPYLGQKKRSPGFRSDRNDGFARGINLLARQGRGEYVFLLNPDAEVAPDCLDRLIERAEADPGIAICEARQQPTEHPKAYDLSTGETTWCSGAAALIRRTAFDEVGGFDDRLFFMYCEDVDLSWKLWLSGWKCVYVPEALVGHDMSQPRPRWRRRMESYYSFRNSLFLFHQFARKGDLSILLGFLLKRFMSRRYSLTRKALFIIAFADHIRYIPYLVTTRRIWGNRAHPWIRLTETSLSE